MGDCLRLNDVGSWELASLSDVQARIAEVILGEPSGAANLGSITLHSHQAIAVQRLKESIDRFNGALLCDEVGMGKTYVALAVARKFATTMVVMPAALVSMWQSALKTTGIEAETMTFEALSRADVDEWRGNGRPPANFAFVIVDEAHHARNPRTNRYLALERLVRNAKVLLLSATPIHNRRDDLVVLLSLFLGSRARSMTSAELAQCVVRREQRQLEREVQLPVVLPTATHEVSDDAAIVEALMNLPPPVPVRDGGVAAVLVGRGLVHQWASSEAALHAALRRRIGRAIALCISLEAGTYPSLAELESWIYDDGALQLGFPELLSSPAGNHTDLLTGVRDHVAALEAIQSRFQSTIIDARRADIVAGIRAERGDARIVAFAQYADTIAMLYRRLANAGYVAMLTSHGARVAGGALSRNEAIARFAPLATASRTPTPAERIHLLLTTDLLSEGVNLQDADMVIHLDVPWTAARMEQRVGRVARLGSRHKQVYVHLIRPPASAARVLDGEPIVHRKWNLARAEEDLPRRVEQVRAALERWRKSDRRRHRPHSSATLVASASAGMDGFVAAVSVDGAPALLVSEGGQLSVDVNAQLRACTRVRRTAAAPHPDTVAAALALIARWSLTRRAASAAGVGASRARRRRDLIARIDSAIESAPPHQRSTRLSLAAQARAIVTASQSAAIERELENLLHADISDEKWLAAIADIGVQQAITRKSDDDPLKVHAVLLLSVRQRRSPPPPDRESP